MGTVNTTDLRIRSGPSTAYSILGYLNTGDRVEVTEQKTTGSMIWGKISKGWICLDYVDFDDAGNNQSSGGTGTGSGSAVTGKVVNTNSLRVRSGPGTYYSIVAYLTGGTKVTITEQTPGGWGRISNGWINMDYVALDSAGTAAKTEAGTVTAQDVLRIRSGPGTSYSIIGYLDPGSRVEISEKRSGSDGMQWGKTANGWISLSYVRLDSAGTSGSTSGSAASSTGQAKTVSADCLHVRSGAGISYPIVGYLYEGAKVTVTETAAGADGRTWGHISNGWICMEYVK